MTRTNLPDLSVSAQRTATLVEGGGPISLDQWVPLSPEELRGLHDYLKDRAVDAIVLMITPSYPAGSVLPMFEDRYVEITSGLPIALPFDVHEDFDVVDADVLPAVGICRIPLALVLEIAETVPSDWATLN